MHILTQKRADKFANDYGFNGSESDIFERYVASIYLHQYLKGQYDLIEESVVGGGDDQGIDIAAVIVNGKPVREPSEIEDIIREQTQNSAKVILIQAKTSENYNAKLVAKFLSGVELVTQYAIKPGTIDLPPKLVDLAILIDTIAANGDKFTEVQVPCELYYVTTSANDGRSVREELQVTEALSRINQYNFYTSGLEVQTHGHAELAAKQKEHSGPQKVQFNFEKRQTIPATGTVTEAYIGLLSASEVLKLLLSDNNSQIRFGIFDDNVRLDLGANNVVNERIMETLCSDQRELFPFLNNGLTIVAQAIRGTGDRFFISGYQVVNGGQTSNQLVRWALQARKEDDDVISKVWIPVKIISSSDSSIRSNISVSTNLQTAISAADIQAGKQKAKDVEEFFGQSGADGLRYARQKSSESLDFPRTRIIVTSELNRAVAAAAFGQSSLAISSPKELELEDSFVWGDYSVEMYYYCAWIVYRIDRYLARASDAATLRGAKYHIAMVTSAILNPKLKETFPGIDSRSNANQLPKKTQVNFEISTDQQTAETEKAIEQAIAIVEEVFSSILEEGRSLRKDDVRARAHQNSLLSKLEEYQSGKDIF